MVMAISLGAAGCASKRPKSAPSTASDAAGTGATGTGANSATSASANAEDEAAGPQGGLLATRVVYFDFDSSEVRGAGAELVAAHARYLAANPGTRVRLEGHTDERGTREYNIGLGERRAQAVRRALMLQGALDGQLSTVSYGEERPAAAGHDEAAWAKNRRVEIVYLAGSTPPTPALPQK
ncbi:MAG: peptidoglycan-associated lipoprotein Pal [Steroidobacteraceae bacterium]